MAITGDHDKEAQANMDRSLNILDRFFTLFFLSTSIIILPTTISLINVSSDIADPQGLLRGVLFASIIGSLLLVVAIYGLAVLLNYQWLRLTGFYGLICIFVEAWLMLASWLSTSDQYWTLFLDPQITPIVNFTCLFISIPLFYLWQKRNRVNIAKITYLIGIVSSFNLFLVFNFLQNFSILNLLGKLELETPGLICVLLSVLFLALLCTTLTSRKHERNLLGLSNLKLKKTILTVFLIIFEIMAAILLLPFSFLSFGGYSIIFMTITVIAITLTYGSIVIITDTSLQEFKANLSNGIKQIELKIKSVIIGSKRRSRKK